jgi:isoleucyl-tRNA synthetase
VKSLEFVPEEGRLVSYRVLPDNKLLGPKFGARFPKVRGALHAAAPAEIAASVRAGQPVTLDVDGEKVELAPAEVLVQTQPAEGLAIASDKLLTVGIDSAITPELRLEGLAREIVRRVQAMRKDAGFNIEDRITTWYQADSELGSVFVGWAAYIQAETLTTQLIAGQPPAEAYVEEHNLDGAKLTIGVKQNRKS